jgi:60Kd inner membrane protein
VALVAAIAALTVALRAALLPAAVSAYRANQARAALVPEIARLRRRYGKDRVRLAEEILAAQRKAGTRPFAGVGAMLVQGLAVASLYRAVIAPAVAGHANALVGVSVLGAPLTAHWSAILAAGGAGPVALLAGGRRRVDRPSREGGRVGRRRRRLVGRRCHRRGLDRGWAGGRPRPVAALDDAGQRRPVGTARRARWTGSATPCWRSATTRPRGRAGSRPACCWKSWGHPDLDLVRRKVAAPEVAASF